MAGEELLIPKLIHFIWVGRPLDPAQVDRVKHWATMNPQYEIWIWTDPGQLIADRQMAHVGRSLAKGEDLYQRIRQSTLRPDQLRAAATRFDQLSARRQEHQQTLTEIAQSRGNIVLKHISEIDHAPAIKLYEMEMVRRGSNPAAGSDIMRIEILIRHGGIYLDVDVACKKPLPQLRCDRDLALWGEYAYRLTNAVIAACPGSQMLIDCRNRIAQNYQTLDQHDLLSLHPGNDPQKTSAWHSDKRTSTINVSGPAGGPGMVGDVMLPGGVTQIAKAHRDEVTFPNTAEYIEFDTPEAERHDWLP